MEVYNSIEKLSYPKFNSMGRITMKHKSHNNNKRETPNILRYYINTFDTESVFYVGNTIIEEFETFLRTLPKAIHRKAYLQTTSNPQKISKNPEDDLITHFSVGEHINKFFIKQKNGTVWTIEIINAYTWYIYADVDDYNYHINLLGVPFPKAEAISYHQVDRDIIPKIPMIKELINKGTSEAEIRDYFKVSLLTWAGYKKAYPELAEALIPQVEALDGVIDDVIIDKALNGDLKAYKLFKDYIARNLTIWNEEQVKLKEKEIALKERKIEELTKVNNELQTINRVIGEKPVD